MSDDPKGPSERTPDPGDGSGRDSTERGFTVKRRRRLPLVLGGIALVAVLVVGIAAIASSRGSDDKEWGTDIKVAWDGSFAYGELTAEYVRDVIGPDYGLNIEPVYLSESNEINRAVNDGKVAATTYEHELWLNEVLKENPDFDLTATTPLWYWTNSIWSSKYRSVDEIPDGATISIESSPANQSRGLWILGEAGLIDIKPGVKGEDITLDDIENPRGFKWKPLDYGAQPRAINDLDAIVGNSTAFIAAEVPADQEIYVPPKQPDGYIGKLVVATDTLDQENVKKLIEAFADPRLQEFVATHPEVKKHLQPYAPPS